jgi:SAUR family protein
MKKGGGASRRRSLKAFLQAWKRLASSQQATGGGRAHLDGEAIPRDVPRGHTVVYVGEELRRYVVRVSCLDHPLFRELLDSARDEYDFGGADFRLCIPCDEDIFLGVLCHVDAEPGRGLALLCTRPRCMPFRVATRPPPAGRRHAHDGIDRCIWLPAPLCVGCNSCLASRNDALTCCQVY